MDPKLFISMIPDGTAEDTLRSVFAPYGEVLELVLLPKKGPFLNAFVRYFRTDSCDEAIAGLNGRLWLRGAVAPLSVKYAVYKPRKEFSNKSLPTSPNPMKMDTYKKECNGNVVEDEASFHNLRNETKLPDTTFAINNSVDEPRLEGWSNRLNDLAKLVANFPSCNKNSDSNNPQALRLGPLDGIRTDLGSNYNVNETSKVNRISDLPYVPFEYDSSKPETSDKDIMSVSSILSTAKIANLNIAQELQSIQKLRQSEISALCNTIDELKEQLSQATISNITQEGQIKDLESKLKHSHLIQQQQQAHISLLTRRVKDLESQQANRGSNPTDLSSMIRLEVDNIWDPLPHVDDIFHTSVNQLGY